MCIKRNAKNLFHYHNAFSKYVPNRSAFFWFCNDERAKVRAANPDMGVGDVAKQLGAAWSNTPPEAKAKYEALAASDKERYEKVSCQPF